MSAGRRYLVTLETPHWGEEADLRTQLAVIESKLDQATARKLDWRNVAID